MENYHDNEELASIAPKLSAIPKKELHESPQGYFEQLPGEVLAKIKEAPVLLSLYKKELHEAPEGYFDQLDQRLGAIMTRPIKVVSMRAKVVRWTAVAAGICFLVTAGWIFSGKNQSQTIASVTDENTQVDNYLIEEMNEDDMIAYMTENGTVSAEESDDEVMDYLIEESDEADFID